MRMVGSASNLTAYQEKNKNENKSKTKTYLIILRKMA